MLLFIALIALQFVEVERTNPPVTGDLKAPAEVKKIFKKSCYDCHSNETEWPWYSHVAPVSWLIIDDVNVGRKQLNFSEWERLASRKRNELKKEIWNEINKGNMPLKIYTYVHPASTLDLTQKNIIKHWASGTRVWD
ncbi:MAG: heme-binding protein [Ignavibacteria bacterium]|nr:heme-binding protein [Ignavibacteria bacterium]